ncbi:hypothetical protein L484_012028 [Morus notabilis]|uniref:Uncharacterized protein n=1 Tax=Morus notabilis TaxID=981085 RepID=W9QZN8_9ROSA|nr:hypothetical protein L484_012028 [Morus notabilis]
MGNGERATAIICRDGGGGEECDDISGKRNEKIRSGRRSKSHTDLHWRRPPNNDDNGDLLQMWLWRGGRKKWVLGFVVGRGMRK